MTDIRDSNDIYLEHFHAAESLLDQATREGDAGREADDLTALAQVHATLAQAVAFTRMVDTYDGWKMHGL